jgi:hypothetical protein
LPNYKKGKGEADLCIQWNPAHHTLVLTEFPFNTNGLMAMPCFTPTSYGSQKWRAFIDESLYNLSHHSYSFLITLLLISAIKNC